MANYYCTIRTNYFHVKDNEAFRSLMKRVYGCEGSVELWEEKDKNGKTVFGFGAYGGIAGIADVQDDCIDESSYDDFMDALQAAVADDDAIIILEAGSEKMRYVVGSATIITNSAYEYIDIVELAVEKASKYLNNPSWQTRCVY